MLRNSKIDKVSYLANEASKIGIEVAAGMGTSGNSGSGTSVSGAGVVYYNKAVQDVHALMINNTVTSNSLITLLSNEATSTDFQIAGGLAFNSASGEGTNVGVGGAVAVSQLENNLASGIIGGTYNDFTTVKVEAEKGTTQINGALAATKAGGASGYGFEGAFAYGSVKNSVHAYIDNAMTQDTLALGEVRVRAGEVPIDLDAEIAAEKQLIDKVTKLSTAKKTQLQNAKDNEKTKSIQNKQTLTGTGFDPTGKIYLDNEDTESSIKGDGIENQSLGHELRVDVLIAKVLSHVETLLSIDIVLDLTSPQATGTCRRDVDELGTCLDTEINTALSTADVYILNLSAFREVLHDSSTIEDSVYFQTFVEVLRHIT